MKKIMVICLFALLVINHVNAQWSELGGANSLAPNNRVYSVIRDAAGNIYAAGIFTNSSGNRYVAKWDGTSWSELGGANSLAANGVILTLCSDPSGNIYAAGTFTNSSGNEYVAKWNGSSWSELGGANVLKANSNIQSICSDALGNIYAAGAFSHTPQLAYTRYVVKYNGSTWSELGGFNTLAANNNILSICTDALGNLYAGGSFSNSSSKKYVAKYNGISWSELGGANSLAANNFIESLCVDASGNIYAGGDFTNANAKNYVAKYNGTNWSELGGDNSLAANNSIYSICTDTSGNVYTSGQFNNSKNRSYVAKWNGSSWAELGGLNALNANHAILSSCVTPSGNSVFAAGYFVNGSNNIYIAQYSGPATISSFTPSSASIGSLVTITGSNLNTTTSIMIGGVQAIIISNSATSLVAMVMPGATTGAISITNTAGTTNSSNNFTVINSNYPVFQQGSKLVGTGANGSAYQGTSVAISADGNTAIVSGVQDNTGVGAAWIYTRSGGVWSQQGNKLLGTGAEGNANLGSAVAISADGNTALVGGANDSSGRGAVWVFSRSAGTWTQQGNKLVGSGGLFGTGGSNQGTSVAISADGNTAIVGGYGDNSYKGAVWVFTRSAGVWSQQGSKIVGTTTSPYQNQQGVSVAISADGNTFIEGGLGDDGNIGAAWVFTRSGNTWSAQGSKLIGTGASGSASQGKSVAISADGNTAIVGGYADNGNAGALWAYTRSAGVWSQQGIKLVGTGASGSAYLGYYPIAISADGNTVAAGGVFDNGNKGAMWIFGRTGTTWSQQGSKLFGTGSVGSAIYQGAVSLSADGNTAIIGGSQDNTRTGAAWVYYNQNNSPRISSFSPTLAVTATTITINGHYFTGATAVSFGGTAATSYTVVNDSTITAVVGSGSSGTVTVTGVGGPASLAGFTYCVNVTPSISIAASTNSVCLGTSIRITATATNGGTSPIYNFLVNGVSVKNGSSNFYVSTTFNNNDVVTCVLTANNVCQTTPTANSNDVTMVIKQPTTSVSSLVICSNQLPYIWNGLTFNGTSSKTYHTTNVVGCDSAATLNLTVKANSTSTTNQSICSSSLPYIWNGLTFNASGSQTYHTTNAAGCDSAATLNLTVNNTSSSQLTITACDSYDWNGTHYTNSGTYNFNTTNSKGCDSVATLILTINSSSSSTTNVTVCSFPYTWNSNVYGTVGSYTIHLTNAVGCDSATTLVLSVSTAPVNKSIDLSGCSTASYNGVAYNSNTTLHDTLRNKIGCDSIYLTINIHIGFQSVIAVDKNPLCGGQIATFTSKVFNADSLQCQWFKNGSVIVGATTLSYSSNSTILGDDVQLRVRSKSAYCSAQKIDTVFSNVIHVVSLPVALLKVTIAASATNICSGANVTFTATATNAVNPVYTWKINGIDAGTNSATFNSNSINNGDIVTCVVTNVNPCQVVNMVVSNGIAINVAAPVIPAPITGATALCKIANTTLLSNTVASGTWTSNNPFVATIASNGLVTAIGVGTSTITYTIGTAVCSAISTATINVAPIVMQPITGFTTVCTGSTTTLSNATPGVTGVWSVVNTRGSITQSGVLTGLIAGGNAIVRFTATNATGCTSNVCLNVAVTTCVVPKLNNTIAKPIATKMSIYPNPARGVVTIDNGQLIMDNNTHLFITDITGKLIKSQIVTDRQTKLNTTGFKPGIYLITIQSAEGKTTEKLVVE